MIDDYTFAIGLVLPEHSIDGALGFFLHADDGISGGDDVEALEFVMDHDAEGSDSIGYEGIVSVDVAFFPSG